MKTLFNKPALLCAAVAFVSIQCLAENSGGTHFVQNYGMVPLRFEPNSDQADAQVRYISRGSGYAMYFMPTQIALALDVSTNADENVQPFQNGCPKRHALGLAYLEFENANTGAVITAEQSLPEKLNYFI